MLDRDLLEFDAFHLPHGVDPQDDIFPPADPGDATHADRIFFAVQPPQATASSISRLAWHLRNKHRLSGKPLRPECFHVSLLFAGHHGRMRPETLSAIRHAAATIDMRRFRVGFDWAVSLRHRDNPAAGVAQR
jgi:2'-5' RNA ligase